MAALKLLETRHRRDQFVLLFISIFLVMSSLLREQYLWSLPYLVVAMLFIPLAASRLLRSEADRAGRKPGLLTRVADGIYARTLDPLHRLYGRVLALTLRYRGATLVLVLAGLAVIFSLYLKRSWMGFAFEAVADDEDTARVLAVDVRAYKLAAFALGTAVLFTSAVRADDYVIDTKGAHAFIQFRIKHLGYSWLLGRFNRFSGTFSFDQSDPNKARVQVVIDTASVDSNHAERDKHLRDKDFLDVKQFPEARFKSTGFKDNGDGTAVAFDDSKNHGQSHTGSFTAVLGGKKRIKYAIQDGFFHTVTAIAYP